MKCALFAASVGKTSSKLLTMDGHESWICLKEVVGFEILPIEALQKPICLDDSVSFAELSQSVMPKNLLK